MKKILFIAAVMPVLAALPVPGIAGNIDLKCGPWLQNTSETEFTVMWTTVGKCLSWVEVAPDDGTAFEACGRQRFYQTEAGKRYVGTFHAVRVTGLSPGAGYRYRILSREVSDDSNPYGVIYGSEAASRLVGSVRTLDTSADTCRFSMLNDIHDDKARYRALTKPLSESRPDFIVLNGDIVSYASSIDTVMEHTFAPMAEIAKDIPVFFARGNHEGRGADSYKVSDLFRTPTGEFYYIFRQGPVAFVVLDGGEDKPDSSVEYSGLADYDSYREAELEWLKTAVKEPLFASAPVKVAVCHIPSLKNSGSWYSQVWLNENFNPVLNGAGVTLMLSGHHHRHIHVEKGECGNDFQIIANDDTDRLDFTGTASGIEVRTYDPDGRLTHSYSITVP